MQLGDGQSTEVAVDVAGFVTISRTSNSLQVVSTRANSGWSVEVEVAQGVEVQGDFRSGTQRVKFSFQIEGNGVRVTIEK